MKRNIIKIDNEKCTGCGLCITNCAEASLAIINGKAVLVREALCDGLGACIGHCPEGALTIEVRDAEEFDENVVEERIAELRKEEQMKEHAAPSQFQSACGCPSANIATFKPVAADQGGQAGPIQSQLAQWPVQLALLPPTAPFFQDADLLIAADCVPFAYADFHRDYLLGKSLAIFCPKLDNAEAHFEKLKEIFAKSSLKSVTALRMEVPCCGGLVQMVKMAIAESGKAIPFKEIIIGRDGTVRT